MIVLCDVCLRIIIHNISQGLSSYNNYLLSSEIESNIEEVRQQISDYKAELQQAQIIRNHRQEYNTLAKVLLLSMVQLYLLLTNCTYTFGTHVYACGQTRTSTYTHTPTPTGHTGTLPSPNLSKQNI